MFFPQNNSQRAGEQSNMVITEERRAESCKDYKPWPCTNLSTYVKAYKRPYDGSEQD